MTAADLLAFNLTLLAAWATPGPAFVVCLQATLAGGVRAGLATGLGLALMAAGWTALALAGLDAVFAVAPWAYAALRIGGALYLLWIAVQLWRHAGAPVSGSAPQARAAVVRGILVNAGNPKSVLFAAAVLLVIFPPEIGAGARALIVLNHFVFEIAAYGLLALALSAPAVGRAYLGAKRWIDRAAGVALGALGLRLLTER